MRTICAGLALASLVTFSGCRHTTGYRSTCAPVCAPACPAPCPAPVVAGSPVAVAAPAPCCNTPGGIPAPPPSPPAFGH
jgi:hypothetical protein